MQQAGKPKQEGLGLVTASSPLYARPLVYTPSADDPSPEFYLFAEPGRSLRVRKSTFAASAATQRRASGMRSGETEGRGSTFFSPRPSQTCPTKSKADFAGTPTFQTSRP